MLKNEWLSIGINELAADGEGIVTHYKVGVEVTGEATFPRL